MTPGLQMHRLACQSPSRSPAALLQLLALRCKNVLNWALAASWLKARLLEAIAALSIRAGVAPAQHSKWHCPRPVRPVASEAAGCEAGAHSGGSGLPAARFFVHTAEPRLHELMQQVLHHVPKCSPCAECLVRSDNVLMEVGEGGRIVLHGMPERRPRARRR